MTVQWVCEKTGWDDIYGYRCQQSQESLILQKKYPASGFSKAAFNSNILPSTSSKKS